LAAYILDKQYPAVTELQEQYSRHSPSYSQFWFTIWSSTSWVCEP